MIRCANSRSSPRESHDFRSLRRRRFPKLATASPVRFAGNTGEPDARGRGKSQRGTLHRQFRYSFSGGGVESVTRSRYAVLFDFGRGVSGAVETEILRAPALDGREAYITTSTKTDSLKHGKCSVTVPHATGLRVTLT